MSFMNTWEIDEALTRYADHSLLASATRTLANLRDAADRNSDGWCYWPKPTRAAEKLMNLIQYDKQGRPRLRSDGEDDVTEADVRAALRPIKAFRTRSGIDFEILEPGQKPERRLRHTIEPNVRVYDNGGGGYEVDALVNDEWTTLVTSESVLGAMCYGQGYHDGAIAA